MTGGADTPIGLYGGTFDPTHKGHTHAALTVRRALALPCINLILSARPGHRGVPASSVEHRWAMLELACAAHEGLHPDDREARRPGKSYTLLTVAAYRDEGYLPCWIVGEDSFATLPDWYRWQEILDHCNLIVITRPGAAELPEAVARLETQRAVTQLDLASTGQIWHLNAPMLPISATDIRRRIAAGSSVDDLLEDSVWTYIKQNHLYMEATA